MNYFLLSVVFFVIGSFVSYYVTPLIMRVALKKKIVATSRFGDPGEKNIALLGGISIFISFAIVVLLFVYFTDIKGEIEEKNIIGVLVGGIIVVIGGILDDRLRLQPSWQLIWPLFAIAVVIASGIGITYITNPIRPDELIYLNTLNVEVLSYRGIPYYLTLPADAISFLWLLGIMYATKLQDGLDGLVSGVSLIASLFIFMLSFFLFSQFDLAFFASIFAGVLLGFIYFNRYPARIYLGEGGSLFTGFVLGSFAILSDAKVVITLIILAVPITDAAWTIIRRTKRGQKFWVGDSEHLHHRLIKMGYSHKKSVYVLYGITALFGMLVFLWQSSFTYYFVGLMTLVVLVLLLFFKWVYR